MILSHTGVPVVGLQNSIVHLSPSSGHEIVCVGRQKPDWQAKVRQGDEVPHVVPLVFAVGRQKPPTQAPVVHELPVSQVPPCGVCTQPVGNTQESSVHGLPSSQLRAVFSHAPVCGLQELTVQASGLLQVTIGVPAHVPS